MIKKKTLSQSWWK